MTFIQFLQWVDYSILRYLNVDMASPFMDRMWLIVTHLERQPLAWLLLILILIKPISIYKASFLKVVLSIGIAVALTDMISYRIIKRMVDRPRPFQNEELKGWLRKVGDAQGPSFPSNHAANTMAGAVILAGYFERQRHYFYIFALLVSISRVTLGVHYPSDVLAGVILGLTVGFLVRVFLQGRGPSFRLRNAVSKGSVQSTGWRTRLRRIEDV